MKKRDEESERQQGTREDEPQQNTRGNSRRRKKRDQRFEGPIIWTNVGVGGECEEKRGSSEGTQKKTYCTEEKIKKESFFK